MVDYPDGTTPVVQIETIILTGEASISGTVTITGTVTVEGSVNISNATIDVTGSTVTVEGSVSITGDVHFDNTSINIGTMPAVSITGDVHFDNTSINIGTMPNVTFTNTTINIGTIPNITIESMPNVTFTNTTINIGTIPNITIESMPNVTFTNTSINIGTMPNVTFTNTTISVTGSTINISGTVAIATAGGTNIIIDKLTVGAYTERRSTLSNDNGVTAPTAPPAYETGTVGRAKFFPRGCRGIAYVPYIYCKRTGSGTITLAISPQPNMGETHSVTITPGSSWDWKFGALIKFWNYDSLYIWVKACSGDVSYGYDTSTPYDAYNADAAGVVADTLDQRIFIRMWMLGETVGDVPVSGTINTIAIPTRSNTRLFKGKTLTTDAETTMVTIEGAGETIYLLFDVSTATNSHRTTTRIYCDGNLAWKWSFSALNTTGYAADTPGISMLKYVVDEQCDVHITLKFSFRRELKITMQRLGNGTTTPVFVEGLVNMVK